MRYLVPGHKQGRLTIVKAIGKRMVRGHKHTLFLLKCGCGNTIELLDKRLHGKNGQISCGCLRGYDAKEQLEQMTELHK